MTRREMLALVASAAPLYAAEKPLPIFNGINLEGWDVQEGPETAFYVRDESIVVHEGAGYPTWLRYNRLLENFEFQCEFFIKGWANGGIFLQAPEHGRPTETGFKINLFQKQDETPLKESVGAIFPLVAPLKVNVKNQGEWNSLRVLMDAPTLKVWINNELIQDINVNSSEELRYKFRSGYIGIESLSYPLRFRNLALRELPSKVNWETLYGGPADLAKWTPMDTTGKWEALGRVLRADGLGYLATKTKYRDFAFQCYIRGSKHHNGGIIFRGNTTDTTRHYEIQLHDVEGAVYPTGSLYHYQRAIYPRIEAERWYPFQLYVQGKNCLVRVNGDTVVRYSQLDRNDFAPIMLQAHAQGRWIEYKDIQLREITSINVL